MSGAVDGLGALAAAAGLVRHWVDIAGREQCVDDAVLRAALDAMDLPAADATQCRDSLRRLRALKAAPRLLTAPAGGALAPPATASCWQWQAEDGQRMDVAPDADGRLPVPPSPGYWKLQGGPHVLDVAVAPQRCFGVDDALDRHDARAWGVALQVYSARSDGDGGIGDSCGCGEWAGRVAAHGGHALALSPMHAAGEGTSYYSPYSPSDRRCLDPLHASPHQVFGPAAMRARAPGPRLAAELEALQAMDLIDWPRARRAKWALLEHVRAEVLPHDATRARDFARFAAAPPASAAAWAASLDGTGIGPEQALFGQWLAAQAWRLAQEQAVAGGMRIGLVADLAVGFDPAGTEAAAAGQAVLRGLELGAPPDAFNADGQAWGITGYSPTGLAQSGFAPFIALLRAVMRDRGGVRIDHILGLQRLWVVPRGATAGQGVYLRYPLQALLDLLALESWRHRCVVIGEDLGVVPKGIRAQLARRGVLGIDVLPFTRDRRGRFLPPARWRRDAVATTSTHDLPTTRGWLEGRDIAWRRGLQDAPPERLRGVLELARRRTDAGLLEKAAHAQGIASGDPWRDALRYTARGPARLALLPAEDALGLREQPNLPGTTDSHPNWRRRLPAPLPADLLEATLQDFADARAGAPA